MPFTSCLARALRPPGAVFPDAPAARGPGRVLLIPHGTVAVVVGLAVAMVPAMP